MAISKEEKYRRNHEFHNSTVIIMTKMITRGSLSFSITFRERIAYHRIANLLWYVIRFKYSITHKTNSSQMSVFVPIRFVTDLWRNFDVSRIMILEMSL